ncbi:hypothetical protein [Luteolibacter sp. AS25]|uniref:hypothetical protein n=1 Tax=Luteolibacter sp. AS25 TaxID=3135776 RepID=UPI00398B2EED
MSRFEIEEILEQDTRGIVFRANDSTTGNTVAIRRFFPFGSEGGGLDNDEAKIFETAAGRLSMVKHESLRSIIHASVDPIDRIPFLVTEWVDGTPLDQVIQEEKLAPGHIIDILRIALEASIQLSAILGEEAIWVETQVRSIVVGTEESGRGFTFWLSPFKWLNSADHINDITPLIELTEELTDWKTKLYRENSYFGLGGWLKNLKAHPSTSLEEALFSLNALLSSPTEEEQTGTSHSPASVPTPPAPPSPIATKAGAPSDFPIGKSTPVLLKKSKSPVPFVVAALLAIIGALGFLYTKQKSRPIESVRASSSETPASISEESADIDPESTPASQQIEEAEPEVAEIAEPPTVDDNDIEGRLEYVFSPLDYKEFSEISSKPVVKLTGIISDTNFSQSGKHLYLTMALPNNDENIRGVIRATPKTKNAIFRHFKRLKGKKIQISGTKYSDGTKKNLVLMKDQRDFKYLK